MLGLKNVICKDGTIKFLGDNETPINPHFKTITNILSIAVDTENCTADVYIGGKIILWCATFYFIFWQIKQKWVGKILINCCMV